MRKKIVAVLLVVFSVFVLVLGGLYFFQEKLIFHPTKLDQDYEYTFSVPHEELFIDSPDGARLNAVLLKAEKPKGVLVYFHGNAGDLSKWGQIGSFFTSHNYDVLMWDYRSFGKSRGKLSEEAIYSDAQLIYDKAREYYPEGDIILYGRSIGSAPASFVARNNNPRKLILESPFYSLEQLVAEKYSFLPTTSMLNYKMDNGRNVANAGCRIIYLHGDKDELIPIEHSATLYKVTPEEFRTFVRIPGGRHNDLVNSDAYKLAIYKELL